jgi:hypothetical protein
VLNDALPMPTLEARQDQARYASMSNQFRIVRKHCVDVDGAPTTECLLANSSPKGTGVESVATPTELVRLDCRPDTTNFADRHPAREIPEQSGKHGTAAAPFPTHVQHTHGAFLKGRET